MYCIELLASSRDCELAVGLAAIALQITALSARKEIPVDVAQIVTWDIGAVLGELLAEAEVRRTMQAGNKAIHYRLRQQVQGGDAGQHCGIEEARASALLRPRHVTR